MFSEFERIPHTFGVAIVFRMRLKVSWETNEAYLLSTHKILPIFCCGLRVRT